MDLDNRFMQGRPIVHVGAVQDHETAKELGEGGAFTTSMLKTLEKLINEGNEKLTAVEYFNALYGKYSKWFKNDGQTFSFQFPKYFDPDTFEWPLVPPRGWKAKTLMDYQLYLAGHRITVPCRVRSDRHLQQQRQLTSQQVAGLVSARAPAAYAVNGVGAPATGFPTLLRGRGHVMNSMPATTKYMPAISTRPAMSAQYATQGLVFVR